MAQAEPKLFPIAKRSSAAPWKVASAVLAVVAVGAGAVGYQQYSAVRRLRTQLADTTAEANQAAREEVQLRSQLNAAQNRINSQGTRLSAAEQQSDAEQQELAAARQQATAAHQQLTAVAEQIAHEQQQLSVAEQQVKEEKRALEDARTQLAVESRPELPVRLQFLDSARAGTKVAVLQNLSNAELDVTLDVQSPGSNAHTRKQLVLAAHGVLRMGPVQGWTFTPGQIVTLDNAKFRRMVQTVS